MKRLTIEFVRNQFEKEGYVLLTDSYENNEQKLKYKCPEGHEHSISWGNWQSGHRCVYCSKRPPINIKYVAIEFNKEGYRLLSKKYINCSQKLKCVCPKGHRFLINWDDWKQGTRCCYCGGTAKKDFEFVKSEFEKENYELLSTEYINSRHKLEYICPQGHKNSMVWTQWQCGHRCPTCFFVNNSGSNNPAWRGGISFEPYCPLWADKEYKEAIKERDGYRCLNPYCFMTDFVLNVHHINYNKKACGPENLITLCRSCNSRANKDRKWHTQWYQIIMNKRYGYAY